MTQAPTLPANSVQRKPRDDEIDVYGVSHPGKVRKENQDQFLICSLRKQVQIRLTSLPDAERLMADPERLAFVAMVADGVGGGAKGGEASRIALEAVTQYVSQSMQCFYAADRTDDAAFIDALQEAALQCHQELLRRGDENSEFRGMATTLTVYLGVWPRAYLLQVGDSRCYLLRDGELTQITRDQTIAQELIDLGVLTRADAANTRLAHSLSSSLGGRQTEPVVTRFDMNWSTVVLLCSDGLTKHVSDERIRDRLRTMTSAQQVCEDLLNEALEAGGTDNISIIVGRALVRPSDQEP
jgi:serine/threonine protein phosphatase PrpC